MSPKQFLASCSRLVEAHSLREAAGLNGEYGRVCEVRNDGFVVCFERGLAMKALKAHNLRFIPSPPSPPEDEEDVELRCPPLPPSEDEGNALPDTPPPPPPILQWYEVDAHRQQANTSVTPAGQTKTAPPLQAPPSTQNGRRGLGGPYLPPPRMPRR